MTAIESNHPLQRQDAQALAASELRYRRLFESAQDGILILDADTGMVVDVNPYLIGMLGYSYEQFVGKAIWELGFFTDIIANQKMFLQLQQREYVRYEHLPLKTINGDIREVEFVSNVYLADEKKVIQCNIRDITERRRAEEEHTRLAMAVEQSAETIMITDRSGNMVYANPAFETSTGYTREESMGRNPRFLKSGKQDEAFYRRMWSMLDQGRVWRGRFTNKHKDGSLYEEAVSISPVTDAEGKTIHFVATKRNITHEVQLEDQLRQAQKMEAVGRLAGGVAHDFNNLLTGIMGYAELCRQHLAPDHPIREWLDEIMREAERSAEITRQLLAFARKQTIAPRVLDLNDSVTGMLKLLRRLIGEDIELAWHPGARLWPVTMDPSQVDQILANLCVNARDALAGVGSLTLETENISMDAAYCAGHLDALPGDFVQLTVSDNGCGMDSATLAQIFEPFFSTKGVGQGPGLGLATVYGIVKQNNGFIHASSELGRGTCFHVYLPRTMNVAAPTVAHPAVEAPRGHGETILLVEDEPSLRTLGTHSMTSLGYVVLVAESPEVALRMAATHKGKISLLLTDVVMPGMNGQQLAERILADQPAIKVLFMSGYPADVIAQRGVLERDMSFLPKPFLRADLACKLREMLDGSPGAARLPA